MSNVTIGVIGAGLIGRKHLRKISEQPDYDLVGIADVNVDAVAAEYGVRAIPTMILFKGGKEEERVVGATSKEAISRMIDKHVAGAATA